MTDSNNQYQPEDGGFHASVRIAGRVGDVDPLNDGGAILDHNDGRPNLVYLIQHDADDVDEYGEPQSFALYCADLDISRDIEETRTDGGGWISAKAVAGSMDQTPDELIAMARSENPMERAGAVITVASYYGWDSFDSSPTILDHDGAENWVRKLEATERRSQHTKQEGK